MHPESVAGWKHILYARAAERSDELAQAAHALLAAMPSEAQWTDFLDFFSIEWVDAEGWTEVERAVAAGALPAEALRWPREVRTALWVVDGWEGELVLLRDVATEEEIAVHSPSAEADLPVRSVVRARVIPIGARWHFSGAPDIWEPMGVLARMGLLAAWREGPEPDLITRLRELREAFLRQREERLAFLEHFGRDEVVFADAADMERQLAEFVHHLINVHAVPSLGGRTRASAFRESKGEDPKIIRFALGETLTGPGRHGAIFDAVEGIHFLPCYGEFLDHIAGRGDHPAIFESYLRDPGITSLPFRRAAFTTGIPPIAERLGLAEDTLDALLSPYKTLPERAAPNVLPGL